MSAAEKITLPPGRWYQVPDGESDRRVLGVRVWEFPEQEDLPADPDWEIGEERA